ncbi:virus tail fiber assembly protein lambda gpK [Buttiauxella sp. JUb87]|uniref:tail fiber assembly protein n=1 Tax=Buttiauxella sp. JUb87 TaxID=2485129 RepID=UPI00105E7672|nr:tail fiber assembly protein [Buttiauxella sp. JUb87]TDN51019.1 virus tail fiber assembly protein lambda gpK [Buttiauxella sp. JUb87]
MGVVICSVYSPSENAIYQLTLYSEYIAAGTWPMDGIDITDEDANRFNGGNKPLGKMLGMVNGNLAWIDEPPMTQEQLIAHADVKKQSLINAAMQSINVLQLKLQTGRTLTDAENVKLNTIMDYIDAVTAIDVSDIPNVNLPDYWAE